MTRGRKRLLKGLAVVALAVISVWAYFRFEALPFRRAPKILEAARLAPLPPSATDLKAGGWSLVYSGESFVMFRASPEDIEAFIRNSPSIRDAEPEVFSPEHMHLPVDQRLGDPELQHRYFDRHGDVPAWYDPVIRRTGRRWEIPAHEHHNWGSVIIDDETSTVYINVVWS